MRIVHIYNFFRNISSTALQEIVLYLFLSFDKMFSKISAALYIYAPTQTCYLVLKFICMFKVRYAKTVLIL